MLGPSSTPHTIHTRSRTVLFSPMPITLCISLSAIMAQLEGVGVYAMNHREFSSTAALRNLDLERASRTHAQYESMIRRAGTPANGTAVAPAGVAVGGLISDGAASGGAAREPGQQTRVQSLASRVRSARELACRTMLARGWKPVAPGQHRAAG